MPSGNQIVPTSPMQLITQVMIREHRQRSVSSQEAALLLSNGKLFFTNLVYSYINLRPTRILNSRILEAYRRSDQINSNTIPHPTTLIDTSIHPLPSDSGVFHDFLNDLLPQSDPVFSTNIPIDTRIIFNDYQEGVSVLLRTIVEVYAKRPGVLRYMSLKKFSSIYQYKGGRCSVRRDSNFKNHITLPKPHFRFVPKVRSPYYKEFCRVNYLFNIPWIGIDFSINLPLILLNLFKMLFFQFQGTLPMHLFTDADRVKFRV